MATAASVLQSIPADEWNAGVYGALSLVSDLAVSVRKKANVIRIAYSLRTINRKIDDILGQVHGMIESRIPAPPKSAAPVSDEELRGKVRDMMQIYRSMEQLFLSMKRVGLMNNSLTSGQLLRFKVHSEAMLDLVDWLETGIGKDGKEEIDGLFARARVERDSGAIYDLEQVM